MNFRLSLLPNSMQKVIILQTMKMGLHFSIGIVDDGVWYFHAVPFSGSGQILEDLVSQQKIKVGGKYG